MEEALFSAHRDLESRHWWFRGRREASVDLGMLLVPRGGSLLDVGCGTGADTAAFPASCRRDGLDISPTAIAFARESHPDVIFEVGESKVSLRADGRAFVFLLGLALRRPPHGETQSSVVRDHAAPEPIAAEGGR